MNKVLIPDELNNKIGQISDYCFSVFVAPTGYGKTTTIKTYLTDNKFDVSYITAIKGAEELFYEDIVEILSQYSDNAGLVMPEYDDYKKIKLLMSSLKFEKDKYIVIDDFHNVDNEKTSRVIHILLLYAPKNLHFILLSAYSLSSEIHKMILKDEILFFDKKYFMFSTNDISKYFELNGCKLSNENVYDAYQKTLGWILAVNILMEKYKENMTFFSDNFFDMMVSCTLWDFLNVDEKHVVIALVKLKKFTFSQVELLAEEYEGKIDTKKIVTYNPYVMFDDVARKYKLHPILISFAEKEYANYSLNERYMIIKKTANVFLSLGNGFEALKGFYEAKDFESIVKLDFEWADFYPYATSRNKEMILSIIKEFPKELRMQNYNLMMKMCMVLFLYNDRENMLTLYNEISESIENNRIISQKEKNLLFGQLYYVRGYIEFNDLEYMTQEYMNAINLLEGSIEGFIDKTPWTFAVPSIAHLFHKEMGKLSEEVNNLIKCMPFYYRITNGHGKGAEAMFNAEELFLTGDYKGAEVLCHKAAYMADTREQVSISLCSILLLIKMSIAYGDYDKYVRNYEAIKQKAETIRGRFNDIIVDCMIDLCEASVHIITGNTDSVAGWLKDWESIEKNTNILSRSYANIIYGKYLYLNGENEKLLGISSQFLGNAAVFENVIPKIYTYIYIAMANKATGEHEKAIKMLRLAFDFAVEDNIVMPFVENSAYLEEIYNNIAFDNEYRGFLRKVKMLAKDYNQGIKLINKSYNKKENYGLTAREYDVAKLAAQRLSNKEIANQLFIAESTVKSNLKLVFNKLGISSRSQLQDLF